MLSMISTTWPGQVLQCRDIRIPPATELAIWSDPDLAIANAKASQDHDMHGCNPTDRILILILTKANFVRTDQVSTGL